MAPDVGSGAAGRQALATFRDDDWESFVAAVRYLPQMARDEGMDVAIAFAQTELRSMVSLMGVAHPPTKEARAARASVAAFFEEGVVRLLCDGDAASVRAQTAFITVVHREFFETGVRAVFEQSSATEVRPYVPLIRPAG